MEICTIGFAKKTAEGFFGLLRRAGIKRVLDVRLNNTSQLAGFTKREDLPFFLQGLCGATYTHEPMLAPTQEILDAYRAGGSWDDYQTRFVELLTVREVENLLDRSSFGTPTALLCSEPGPEQCHRRLVAEYLRAKWTDVSIRHL